jgi:soluble epoxide hydrolase / lipid-phosphate phosphatase
MSILERVGHITPAGNAIAYYYNPPATPQGRTIVLIHGVPDNADIWYHLIHNYLKPAGYGVLAPDLLGFGSSSTPDDPSFYGAKQNADDLSGLLMKLGLDKIIVVGHDLGSIMSARLLNYHPWHVSGMILISTAYPPPAGTDFDLDTLSAQSQQHLGYDAFGYFPLFTKEDGFELLDNHIESFFTALHGTPQPENMIKIFGRRGALVEHVESDTLQPVESYAATEEFRRKFIEDWSKSSFKYPLLYYRGYLAGIDKEAEREVIANGQNHVRVPHLFVASLRDPLSHRGGLELARAVGLIREEDLTIVEIDASHWSMLEKPDEVGQAIKQWLEATYTDA